MNSGVISFGIDQMELGGIEILIGFDKMEFAPCLIILYWCGEWCQSGEMEISPTCYPTYHCQHSVAWEKGRCHTAHLCTHIYSLCIPLSRPFLPLAYKVVIKHSIKSNLAYKNIIVHLFCTSIDIRNNLFEQKILLYFSDIMAESRIQFGRHLECPICMERYSPQERIPKVLPCGHTFCHICLVHTASGHRLECPNCKVIHQVPSQGVQGYCTHHATLGMLDYSCEECLKYDQTSRCTHCNNMLCSSCRESHKHDTGDLQKSVIDAISGLQQMCSSLSAEWSVVNHKISFIISQCDIFCSTSKKTLGNSASLHYLESTGDHTSLCVEKLEEIQKVIHQLPSDIPDVDFAGLSMETAATASAPAVSTE